MSDESLLSRRKRSWYSHSDMTPETYQQLGQQRSQ